MKKRLKAILAWFKFEYNSIVNFINFWYMKRKANKLHKSTGKRYFVVPKTDTSLIVVNNTFIDSYNKIKGIKKINIHDLITMSYYSTN